MYQLAILSQDHQYYQQHLELPPQVKLTYTSATSEWANELAIADIILAEPDLVIEHIHKCKKLKWLQSTWAGNRALLQHEFRQYQLTGVKDVFGEQMAEYMLAYMLYFSRNIEGFVRSQQQKQWLPPSFSSLKGKQVAILGTGSIGKEVAKRAKQFSMKTTGFNRSAQPAVYMDQTLAISELQSYAHGFDFVISLLPDTPDTTGLLNKALFDLLPAHCVLLNAGRGNVIEDDDLIEALQNKQIQAAVLDVFKQEPLSQQHIYWQLDNCYITQHTAAKSLAQNIAPVFTRNLQAFIQGQTLEYTLDFNQGY